MKRRHFLSTIGGLAAGSLVWRQLPADAMEGPSRPASPAIDAPSRPDTIETIDLEAGQWRERLTSGQYRVLREEGTERAYSSPLDKETRAGEYLCAGCGLLLFDSEWKYDSGTGWPSFFRVFEDHIGTRSDRKLFFERTEYHCRRCGGHQGHVFEDGPEPTGLRYCNNGLALVFRPAEA